MFHTGRVCAACELLLFPTAFLPEKKIKVPFGKVQPVNKNKPTDVLSLADTNPYISKKHIPPKTSLNLCHYV